MGKFIDFLLAKPKIQIPIQTQTAVPMDSLHISDSYSGTLTQRQPLYDTAYMDDSTHIDNKTVYDEIQKLKMLIGKKMHNESIIGFAGLDEAISLLRANSVSESLIAVFRKDMEEHNTVEKLQDTSFVYNELQHFLKAKICLYKTPSYKGKQRRMVFVGASGVGKTSVMLKIATYFDALKKNTNKGNIRLVNFDRHKAGAKEYFKKNIEWMEIEGESFINIDDVQTYIKKGTRPEVLLVDTSGKNPKNKKGILDLSLILKDINTNAEVFLVISANSSEEDMLCMLHAFNVLQYSGVIITKIDETVYPAKIIGLCLEHSVPIVFMSNGKSIADNLLEATNENVLAYFQARE